MITSCISEVNSQLFTNVRECELKGGNKVDGKEKKESSKEKISEAEKKALRPHAD